MIGCLGNFCLGGKEIKAERELSLGKKLAGRGQYSVVFIVAELFAGHMWLLSPRNGANPVSEMCSLYKIHTEFQRLSIKNV